MSELTNELLLKRATHAGRNMTCLAGLVSAGAIIFTTVYLTSPEHPTFMLMMACGVMAICAGLWALTIATRRGNSRAIAIVVVIVAIQILLVLLTNAYLMIQHPDGNSDKIAQLGGSLIIPFLILIALERSRNVLVELKKRDLWHQVFDASRPTKNVCILGAILLSMGYMMAFGSGLLTGASQAEQRNTDIQQANQFYKIASNEEQVFINSLEQLGGNFNQAQIDDIIQKVVKLESSALALQTQASANQKLLPILTKYLLAIGKWKSAVETLNKSDSDKESVMKLLTEGDELRQKAGLAFVKEYMPEQLSAE